MHKRGHWKEQSGRGWDSEGSLGCIERSPSIEHGPVEHSPLARLNIVKFSFDRVTMAAIKHWNTTHTGMARVSFEGNISSQSSDSVD